LAIYLDNHCDGTVGFAVTRQHGPVAGRQTFRRRATSSRCRKSGRIGCNLGAATDDETLTELTNGDDRERSHCHDHQQQDHRLTTFTTFWMHGNHPSSVCLRAR
jgi:hypothetical protein